jgi:outer membrane protein insertion porin family
VDQVDVNMTVVEKPTGNLSLGAGFSSSEKLTLSASVQQANAFGSGDTMGLDINTSKLNRTIAVGFTNPYFTDDGVSRSFDIFHRTSRPPLVNTGDYVITSTGGGIRFGVPFTEVDTVFFGVGIERTRLETYQSVPGFNDSPQLYLNYVKQFGNANCFGDCSATTTSIPLTVAWQRDSRDSAVTPSVGRYQRANFEISAISDQRYYRATYQHQYFKPLFQTVTLALNGEFDYGKGLGGRPYPVFKNFYAGGIGSVRGFDSATLGPHGTLTSVDPVTGVTSSIVGDALGGSKRLIGNLELQFPFPGSGKDRTVRWFTFLDGGNVFAETDKIRFGDLRYSAGLGISWISPIGPLKLSYGKPLNSKPGDNVQKFQFQLGTGF